MADRYCPSCGTEVDADARFCPTCGITLETDDQPELPAAPAWPQPEPTRAQAEPEPIDATDHGGATETANMAAVPDSAVPDSAVPDAPPAPPEPGPIAPVSHPARVEPAQPVPPAPPAAAGIDLPFTWPTALSGWLTGIGSAVGALALIPNFGNVVSLLLFLALTGVAAAVFLADRVPHVPRLRLWILVISMVGLGVALDRAGIGFVQRGTDSVLLIAMLAAAGGALLIELDRDRPMPPSERTGG
ncbi:MAG TPA: zinc-ribbon domain-containing protein [Candidatus Limnocylindria bacterium]